LPLPPVLSGLVLRYLTHDDHIDARFDQNFPSVEDDADRSVAQNLIKEAAGQTPRRPLSDVMKKIHPVLHDSAMYVTALEAGFEIAEIPLEAIPGLSIDALQNNNLGWFTKLSDMSGIAQPEARKNALAIAASTVVAQLKGASDATARTLLAGILHTFMWTGMHTALQDAGLPASNFPNS
jgi:hypothetical protein